MNKEQDIKEYMAPHYIQRSNWIRAAVLGANDGILSTASLAIGVAAATDVREPLLLATLAGLVAGSLSMAAGEYVSVSSQTDIEKADIERERRELEEMPELEMQRLAEIYMARGLSETTAKQVAKEFTEKDALGAHIRDELGITANSQANPLQAALASGASFLAGGAMPLILTLFWTIDSMEFALYISTVFFLALLGAMAARAGGSSMARAIGRIVFWGTLAMLISAGVGRVFNVNI